MPPHTASDSDSTEDDSDDDSDEDDEIDADPQQVQLSNMRTLPKSRVDLLAVNPVPAQYESPPRPRLITSAADSSGENTSSESLDVDNAMSCAIASDDSASGAAAVAEESEGYQSGDEAEAGLLSEPTEAAEHNDFEYWRLPVMSIELLK